MSAPQMPNTEGLKLCSECHHYYRPETGEIVAELQYITNISHSDDEPCKPCKESIERSLWPDR